MPVHNAPRHNGLWAAHDRPRHNNEHHNGYSFRGMAWAQDALHAWELTKDIARWNGSALSRLNLTPNWTVSRAHTNFTSAYALNAAGVLVPFAADTLRRTDRGALIEGARTFRGLYPRDLTNAAWTATNCTVARTSTGADGVANSACRLTATAGNATVLQSVTHTSTARYFSAYVRRITGSGNVDVTLDNGSTWTTVTLTSSYTRVGAGQTLANPTFGFRIVTSGDAIDVDFAQIEDGAFPSSPVDNTSSSATRAADSLTITSVTGLDYPLTLFAEFERAVDTLGVEGLLRVDDSTGNNRALLYVDASDLAAVLSTSGGVAQSGMTVAGALALATRYKIAARFNTNSVQMARGGTLGTEDVSATNPATPNKIWFGDNAGSAPSFGYFRRAAIFSTAKADAFLQAITT